MGPKVVTKRQYLVLSLVLAAVYLWVGTRPRLPHALGFFPDWLGHGLAYGVLAWVLRRGMNAFVPAAIGATGHGILLEWLQKSVPGRSAEVTDVLADALGAILGAWLVRRPW